MADDFGINVFGDDTELGIRDGFKPLKVVEKGTWNPSAEGHYRFGKEGFAPRMLVSLPFQQAYTEAPIVLIRPSVDQPVGLYLMTLATEDGDIDGALSSSGLYGGATFPINNENLPIDYICCFPDTTQAAVDDYGVMVYGSNGETIFNSSDEYVDIRDAISITNQDFLASQFISIEDFGSPGDRLWLDPVPQDFRESFYWLTESEMIGTDHNAGTPYFLIPPYNPESEIYVKTTSTFNAGSNNLSYSRRITPMVMRASASAVRMGYYFASTGFQGESLSDPNSFRHTQTVTVRALIARTTKEPFVE